MSSDVFLFIPVEKKNCNIKIFVTCNAVNYFIITALVLCSLGSSVNWSKVWTREYKHFTC